MTGSGALTPSAGSRLDTTDEVGPVLCYDLGSLFIIIFCSGLELKHWKEMVENPRRPIVHWHVLKVRGSRVHCGDVNIVNRLDWCVLILES